MVSIEGTVVDVIHKEKNGKSKTILVVYVRGTGNILVGVNGDGIVPDKVMMKNIRCDVVIPFNNNLYCSARKVEVE